MGSMTATLTPAARWTDDCQGKKDYDGRLLDISTRYWPARYRSDGRPSAHAAIRIQHGEPNEYGYAAYTVWRDAEFDGATEQDVKRQVEDWVATQFADVLRLLGTV
jgi:hypothetical protein